MKKYIILISIMILGLGFSLTNAQVLKPNDGIELTIYNIQEDISGEYYVQKDSTLQLPFVRNIKVVNRNYDSVKKEIIQKYSDIYQDPEIMIEPLYRINVLGEVRNPGEYYITGVETITDLIAKAGGETPDSDLSEVILSRNNEERTIDVEEILEGDSYSKDVDIKPGDRIYVPKTWIGGTRNTNLILYGVGVVATIVGIFVR